MQTGQAYKACIHFHFIPFATYGDCVLITRNSYYTIIGKLKLENYRCWENLVDSAVHCFIKGRSIYICIFFYSEINLRVYIVFRSQLSCLQHFVDIHCMLLFNCSKIFILRFIFSFLLRKLIFETVINDRLILEAFIAPVINSRLRR